MRTLNNQTLPDKTSKSGIYPIIDTKSTISCTNEFNSLISVNQDNISLTTQNIDLVMPPSEEPVPPDPCAPPSGGWFETTGRRPVTWKALTEAPYGPGYERMYRGTPLYQYFYVRVPYGWDYETQYAHTFANYPWWDWQFTTDYSMRLAIYGVAGSGIYQWRYTNENGLHLVERGSGLSSNWYLIHKIGKLSDWQCTGATPYKDNAVPLPCTFLITPNDYACGSYAVLKTSLIGSPPVDWTVPINMSTPSEFPWNAPSTSPEAGPVKEVPIVLECAKAGAINFDHKQGYILQREGGSASIWDWKLSGGRYRTYINTCDVYTGWLAWSYYDINDKNNSLWYPSDDVNCCNGGGVSEPCPLGVKEITGAAVVGSVLLIYKWEVLSDTSISLTIYEGAVYYFPTFNITNINYVTFEQSLNFEVSRPATRTLSVNTYGDGYFRITNGGLPTIYYCRNNGEINLYESSVYPWFT